MIKKNVTENDLKKKNLTLEWIIAIMLSLACAFGVVIYTTEPGICIILLILTLALSAYFGIDEYKETIYYYSIVASVFLISGVIALVVIKENMLERGIMLVLLGLIEYMNLRRVHFLLGMPLDVIMPAMFLITGIFLTFDNSWFPIGCGVYFLGYMFASNNIKRYKNNKKMKYRGLKVLLILGLIGVLIINYDKWAL